MQNNLKLVKANADPFWMKDGFGVRFQDFQNLMRYRIRDVLIVSSLYDFFIFEEDGRIYELLLREYQGLNLSHTPELTHVSSGRYALDLIEEENRFDLVITTLHIEGMTPNKFAKLLRNRKINIPLIMLAFDNQELAEMIAHGEDSLFDKIFIWQGNYRLLLAMIKYLEDKVNAAHDTKAMGVQSIILIEDNIRYYSTLLPLIYVEVINQSLQLIKEGLSLLHKNLRQRARPKILLCSTYEEAWDVFEQYKSTILGIISDVEFNHNGQPDNEAGFKFAKAVQKQYADIPIMFQSSLTENREKAIQLGCKFATKDSEELLAVLRDFMRTNLGFGDFIFRNPEGESIGRATDLLSMEKAIKTLPVESIKYHAERNHFSNWLKARTEFWLAYKLRDKRASDFASIEALRRHLRKSLRNYRKMQQRGTITDFDPELFDPAGSISRFGDGSLGGKARGLGFINMVLNNYEIRSHFKGVRIEVPAALIIATNVFDEFLELNNLTAFVLETEDDLKIQKAFKEADRFPSALVKALTSFLKIVKQPLAVRSSGLLEDSHVYPFAGVYDTFMLPNSHPDLDFRLTQLLDRIKAVYASAYLKNARDYIKATSFHLEEEKMAVIIQLLSGNSHNSRFYPVFSGTAQSYNFYPVYPQESKDGLALIALGLGKMVVEGGRSVRFSPRYPQHILQFSSPAMALENNQFDFFALSLENTDSPDRQLLKRYPLAEAEKDGTLDYVGSTYSAENDSIYDGIFRPGTRLVTFSPILKNDIFPLPQILELLLELGSWSMGTPVDLEFAVDLTGPKGKPKKFSLLQIRPMVLARDLEEVSITEIEEGRLLCQSDHVLGNGIINDITDIILVDREKFDRSMSVNAAEEISRFNEKLNRLKRPYLLVGVGRWGSLDPWLGIPVKWSMISGARAIVEAGFKDFEVDPSCGSHFLENLNSFSVGYFTIGLRKGESFLDWDWLYQQHIEEEQEITRHITLPSPLMIRMSGRRRKGIILRS